MREENFWCKKPRYSEVRVIARRVIARYDCISIWALNDPTKGLFARKLSKPFTAWLATHLSPRALTSFAPLRKSKIYGLTSSINSRRKTNLAPNVRPCYNPLFLSRAKRGSARWKKRNHNMGAALLSLLTLALWRAPWRDATL